MNKIACWLFFFIIIIFHFISNYEDDLHYIILCLRLFQFLIIYLLFCKI